MRLIRPILAPILFTALYGVAASPSVEDGVRAEASGQYLNYSAETIEPQQDGDPLGISTGESCEEAIADLGSSEGVCLGAQVLPDSLEGEAPDAPADDATDFELAAASDCVPYSTSRKISDYVVERADSFIYIVDGNPKSCGGVSVRTVLGDRTPNYRVMFEWEYGTAITFSNFVYRVRKSDAFADTVMAPSNNLGSSTVSFSNSRVWIPSSTGTRSSGTYLTGDAGVKYHEDFGLGTINTAGKTFAARTMHTGRWNRCSSSTGCKYYQVPWSSNP